MADTDHDFVEVARGFYLEALLIVGDTVWYTDVASGGARELGTDRILLPDRTMVGGLLQNYDGRLLVSGADGIVWVDPERGRSGPLVEGIGGVNEMRADKKGGVAMTAFEL